MGNVCSRASVREPNFGSHLSATTSNKYVFDKNKARITLVDNHQPGVLVLSAPNSPARKNIGNLGSAQPSLQDIFSNATDELDSSPLLQEESLLGLLTCQPNAPTPSPTPFSWSKGAFLGQGAYGTVYQALNAATGELFAVKQMQFCTGATPAVRLLGCCPHDRHTAP